MVDKNMTPDDASANLGESPMPSVETTGGPAPEAMEGMKKKRTAIIVVACVAAAALLAAGIGLGINARNERMAREAHERAVATAQARCDRSIDGLTAARGMLARQIKADRTQSALKLTYDKVADAKTLQSLRKESTDRYAAASCKATSIGVLDSHVKANQEASRKAAGQTNRLTVAVTGVEKSKAAKDEANRKAEEARKTEEQRKAQEAAAAAATAQAQQQAQTRQQSSRRNSGSANPSRPYRQSTGYRRRSTPSYTPRQQRRQTPSQQPRRQQPPQQEHHWNLGGDAQTSQPGGGTPHIDWGN